MKKLVFLFTFCLLLVSMAWGANLVNENIQTWTARASYGTYTQTISAGTVNMVQCIVQPTASASGTGTIGRVQMQASNGILTLPSLSSIGTITFNIAAGGAGRTVKLQSGSGSSWSDITTFTGIGTTGSTFNYNLNNSSATQIRLASPSSAIYVHDIIITDFVPAGNNPPSINDVTINPSTGITSSTDVTVSATITDSDGTVAAAEVYWGTVSGNRPNSVEMTNTSGDFWQGTIPAQANNTTVYYSVYAMDDDADDAESTEASYTVIDPVPTISVNPATRTGFTYVVDNGPSASQTFSVSGSTLNANIVITASTNYEISEDGTLYASPITLTQSGGAVGSTTIYVRLKAGRAVGAYNNEDITITSTGADSKTVTCSGDVIAPPPPSAPTATAATAIDDNAFTANWSSVSGATGYRLDVYEKEVGATATDLFFSEYIEGGSYNKAIEIFNGTGSPVNLSNYSVKVSFNLNPFTTTMTLPDIELADGDVYVIAHGSANAAILAVADVTDSNLANFNGDDAVGLFKNDVLIDIIGVESEDLGAGWNVAGVTDATANKTLVRKSSVQAGNTDWAAQAGTNADNSEWIVYAQDTSTYLGAHTFAGGSTLTYVTGFNDGDVSNVTSYEVTNLDPETTYYYVVRAYDAYSQTSSSSNEIEVTTTAASTYDYPEDTEIDAGEVLIEITGGNGIILTRELTPVLNPNFTVTFEQAIELTGDGPWIVTVFSLDEWVACLFDGSWIVEEVDGTGYVYFYLEIPGGKNTVIELKSGNGGNPTLPVELSTFTATISSINNAVLTWVTQTETNVNGFYIYRNMENNLESAIMVSNLIPATNTSTQQVYQFTDKELNQTGTYYYWLMVADMDGSEGFHGPISLNYEQGGLQLPEIPKFTELKNVYPNPFNPSTTISYALANSQNVNFNIFNNRGQMVRSMELGNKAAGNHSFVWDGCDNYGRSVSTGVYFIRMQAGSESFSKKAVLMK